MLVVLRVQVEHCEGAFRAMDGEVERYRDDL